MAEEPEIEVPAEVGDDELAAALDEALPEDQLAALEQPQMSPGDGLDGGGMEDFGDEALMAQVAAGAEAAAAEEDDDESAGDEEGVEVEEHLKDAVEGSLRLKRLLSRDEDEATPSSKKRKVADSKHAQKMKQILTKWGLLTDYVVRHILDDLTLEELETLDKSGYTPDKFNMWKSPSELLARFTQDMKERKFPPGGACDAIGTFKHRWKSTLDVVTAHKKLTALTHKELRYVLANYDGTADLDEVIAKAEKDEPEDDYATVNAVPDAPGASTMGRFTRLELIDPLADCAVFGDANLTFAIKLAKHRKALGHVGRVIATTFEDLETLRARYKEIDESIQTLEDHFAEVYHGVDCTRIAIDPRFKGMEGTLGAVYYNFPHSGAIQGFFDGHPVVNWRHENLMRLFFRALRSFVKPGGVVKIASNMGAVGVRYSYIVGSGLENEFEHTETMQFLEWHLHRYGRSYGDKRDVYKRPDAQNNQSYNAQRAEADMVYCFEYKPTGKTLGKQEIRLPPSLKTLRHCSDGPMKGLQGVSLENVAKQLHSRFVMEVSGTHVG